MNSKDVGNISEAMVLAALLKRGEKVLMPFGDNLRYDIALDRDGELVRIQCKTGKLENEVIIFSTRSVYTQSGRTITQDYVGGADFFGVFCPDNEKVYLIPVSEVGKCEATLRVVPTKHGQTKKIRMATDYEIS